MVRFTVTIPVRFANEPALRCYKLGIRANSWSIKMEDPTIGLVCVCYLTSMFLVCLFRFIDFSLVGYKIVYLGFD